MRFNILGLEVEVDLPDDPVAFLKGKVIEILNYMGYEWPVTDTGTLDAWAGQWDDLKAQIATQVAELEGGVRHVLANNHGDVPAAVGSYLNSDSSHLNSLRTVGEAAPMVATAYRAASKLIIGLRAYVIGQIVLDAVSIAAAILSGGASAAVSLLAKKGATMLINLAIDKAIGELMGA